LHQSSVLTALNATRDLSSGSDALINNVLHGMLQSVFAFLFAGFFTDPSKDFVTRVEDAGVIYS
jgi:hypothetical protein